MPRKKRNFKLFIRVALLLTLSVLAALLLFTYIAFTLGSNEKWIAEYCKETDEFIALNNDKWRYVFGDFFDEAKSCDNDSGCQERLHDELMVMLQGKEQLGYFPSTYFIRLDPGENIEKMFLSTEYNFTQPATRREKRVVRLLKNRNDRICTQGFKNDLPFSTMKYLYDLPSEAEIIIPVKDGDQVLGAIVKLWGD